MAKRILLVDDSRTGRLLVRAYLVGRGYDFIEIEDAKRALATIRHQPPDLVICDVSLSGGGLEFVSTLRGDPKPKVKRVPVILVSSRRDGDISRKSLEAGADAFLSKPIAGERLLEIIDELFARPVPSEPSPVSEPISSHRSSELATPPSGREGRPSVIPPVRRGV